MTQSRIQNLALCFGVIALLIAGCRTYSLADEPADLVAGNRTIAQLRTLSWRISDAMTIEQVEDQLVEGQAVYLGPEWESFKGKMQAGDELRVVDHNAGQGVAIFRQGVFVDMYLWAVY